MNENSFWWKLTHLEPAIVRGFIVAVVGLLSAFGVLISPEIPDQLIVFIGAITAMIQALWTRAAVTPNAKVVVYTEDPTDATVYAGEASTNASDNAVLAAARTTYEGEHRA